MSRKHHVGSPVRDQRDQRPRTHAAPAFELLEPRLLLSVGGLGEEAAGGGALPGDTNYDGAVDVLDLAALANNFGATGATWGQGNFNGDTVIDVLDLAIMANHFGQVQKYTLTVNSGSGDGTYGAGATVSISPDAPPAGKVFYKWAGDTDTVADVWSASTTLTMPDANTDITASYSPYEELTVKLREGVGTGFTLVTFDDAQLRGGSDSASGTGYSSKVQNGAGSSYYATLLGIKDLFTVVPKLYDGHTIEILSASLHAFNYLGSSSYTAHADRMTTDWMTGAAGTNEGDVTFLHRDKSADLHWASGNFSSSDYDTSTTATANWGSTWGAPITFDVTGIVQGIYSTETNYGLVLRTTEVPSVYLWMFTSEAGETDYRPYLEFTYTYYMPATLYELVVDGGTGDGMYAAGESVPIAADAAPAGEQFNLWIGDVGYHNGVTTLSTDYVPGSQVDYLWIDGTVEGGDKFKVTFRDEDGLSPQTETIIASSTSTLTTAQQISDAINASAQSNFVNITASYALIADIDTVMLVADIPGEGFVTSTETTESDNSPADGQTFTWSTSRANHEPPANNFTEASANYTMPGWDATVIATYRDADAPTTNYDWWPKFDMFCQDNFGAEIDDLVYDHWGSTMAWEGDGEYEYESKTSAFVACETTLPSKTYVEYGTTTSYGTQIQHDERYNYLHMFYLTGLAESTTYHYRFVAEDERGNILTGADKTLTTATPANVVYLAGGSIASPYVLNQAGKTYLLQADVVAQGRGFEITADNITLDLGGHTVIYNNVDNQVTDYMTSAFGVYGQYRTNTMVINGTLKQGDGFNNASAGGFGYAPVMLYGGSGTEVAGVTMEYSGSQVGGVHMPYTATSSVAHHNVFLDRGGEMINRHQGADAISGPAAHHNLFLRVRHRAIFAKDNLNFYDNEIYVDAVCTNGYGICVFGSSNNDVYGNRIFGGGYMLIGIFHGASTDNADIYDNLIHLQAAEPDWRWPEYGATSNVTGTRNTWVNTNTTVHDNTILVFGRDGGYTRGTWISSQFESTGVVFQDNVIKQKQEGYDQIVDKAAMCMSGYTGADQAVVELRGNRIISNFIHVVFADHYGTGGNTHWYDTTFEKFGSRSDYVTFQIGYAGEDITGHELYDSVFVGGASYDSIRFPSGSTANTWFKVGWTLTVNTDPGATVEIWDQGSSLVASGTANGSGVFTATLIEYKRAPSGKTYETSHHVHTTLGVEFAETDVTMDAIKSIDLYPV